MFRLSTSLIIIIIFSSLNFSVTFLWKPWIFFIAIICANVSGDFVGILTAGIHYHVACKRYALLDYSEFLGEMT